MDVAGSSGVERGVSRTRALLICGAVAPFIYIGSDIVAGTLYPGYSFRSQAPSELFAIGAPTSRLVVILFSLSSSLCLAFALGVWRLSRGQRLLRVLACLIAANGIDSLMLWTLFPMHMRGVAPTSTDTMHLILAANPFVLLSIIVAAAAFPNRFRIYSLATIAVLVALATFAFSYAPQVSANQPTAWLGLSERASQYAHQLWQAVLAVMLMAAESRRATAHRLARAA